MEKKKPLRVVINWKAVEQYLTVVLFVLQFYSLCNFGKLNFGPDRSERVKRKLLYKYSFLLYLGTNCVFTFTLQGLECVIIFLVLFVW